MVFLQGVEEWAFFKGAVDLIYQRIIKMYHLGTAKVGSEAVTFSVASFFLFLTWSFLQLFSNCILVNSEEKPVSINAIWRGASFCLIKQLRTRIGNDTSTEHFISTPWPLANSFCGQPVFHQWKKVLHIGSCWIECNVLTLNTVIWFIFQFFTSSKITRWSLNYNMVYSSS